MFYTVHFLFSVLFSLLSSNSKHEKQKCRGQQLLSVVVAVAVSTAFFWIRNGETYVTILEPGLNINDPIVEPEPVVDPPVEPDPVMEPEPAADPLAEPEEERGHGLRDSRWAEAGFNPAGKRPGGIAYFFLLYLCIFCFFFFFNYPILQVNQTGVTAKFPYAFIFKTGRAGPATS